MINIFKKSFYKQNQTSRSIVVSSDLLIGEFLDESLFKKSGIGEIVWIPNDQITKLSTENGELEIVIDDDLFYICGKLGISNSIRLFITELHKRKGTEIKF